MRVATIIGLCCALLSGTADGGQQIGFAGPFREFGGWPCSSADPPSRVKECNPPAVAEQLPPRERAEARFNRAMLLLDVLKMVEATAELDQALTDDPDNTHCLILRARIAMFGSSNAAVPYLNRILQIEPDNANALASLAWTKFNDDPASALKLATRALAIDPSSVDTLWVRALIFKKLNSFDEAERDLTRAVALEPDVIRVRMARAGLRMAAKRFTQAETDLTAALNVRPELPNMMVRKMRATSRFRLNNYAGAIEDISMVVGVQESLDVPRPMTKELVELYLQRAVAFVRLNKPAEARWDVDAVMKHSGLPEILQLQTYLRNNGFPDLPLDGRQSDRLADALVACFINDACARGVTFRI
jgi:Tfp pilus assembly protein PilF